MTNSRFYRRLWQRVTLIRGRCDRDVTQRDSYVLPHPVFHIVGWSLTTLYDPGLR